MIELLNIVVCYVGWGVLGLIVLFSTGLHLALAVEAFRPRAK